MALSYLLLESGDRLLMEDGSGFLTEDSVDERTGSLDLTLGDITVGSSGALAIKGATAATIGPVSLSAASGVTLGGAITASIGTVTLAASSGLHVAGGLNQSIGEMLLSAAGALQQEGAGVVILTLDPITGAATGALSLTGAMTAGIGPIELASSGETTLAEGTGSLSVNLAPITIVSGGALDIAGAMAASIGAITLAALGEGPDNREGALAALIGAILLDAAGETEPMADDGEPVTLDEVRRQCRVDGTDDDATLDRLRKAARSFVEAYTGTVLITRQVVRQYACWADLERLDVAPVSAISISYTDQSGAIQTLDPATYTLFVGRFSSGVDLHPGQSWPALAQTRAPITATITAGYGASSLAVPQDVRHAILLLVAQWYDNPSAIVSGGVSEMPWAVDALLCNHRRWL